MDMVYPQDIDTRSNAAVSHRMRSASITVPDDTLRDMVKNDMNSLSPSGTTEEKGYSIVCRCAAEFIAVMLFVYIGSLSGVGGGILNAAIAHGCAIFVLISMFGCISGAHINPAVTLGVTLTGKLNPIVAALYIASQLVGGFFGALLVKITLSNNAYHTIHAGATLCARNVTWYEALTIETVTTFILVHTVLMCATDQENFPLAPLSIGFAVLIDILAAGDISGGSMNPARSFGPQIAGQIFLDQTHINKLYNYWTFHFVYYIGPCLGSAIAALVYRVFFASGYRMLP